jgi:hypothetical protein
MWPGRVICRHRSSIDILSGLHHGLPAFRGPNACENNENKRVATGGPGQAFLKPDCP